MRAIVTSSENNETLFLGPIGENELTGFLQTYAVHPNRVCIDFNESQRQILIPSLAAYSLNQIQTFTRTQVVLKF